MILRTLNKNRLVFLSPNFQRNWRSEVVRHTQLKRPRLGPRLVLLVLAHLDENFVLARLERGLAHMLVHFHAVMVLFAFEDFLAVEINANGVVAATTDFDGL